MGKVLECSGNHGKVEITMVIIGTKNIRNYYSTSSVLFLQFWNLPSLTPAEFDVVPVALVLTHRPNGHWCVFPTPSCVGKSCPCGLTHSCLAFYPDRQETAQTLAASDQLQTEGSASCHQLLDKLSIKLLAAGRPTEWIWTLHAASKSIFSLL